MFYKTFYILFVFGLLVRFSCEATSNNSKNDFGNWYSCASDGFYLEMITNNNFYRFSSNHGYVSEWSEFKVNGDTLIQYDASTFKDSIIIKKALIKYVNNKELNLFFIESNEHWTFYRIYEKINNIDNNKELTESTKQRANKFKCKDQRTPSEIEKDSSKVIYFQF